MSKTITEQLQCAQRELTMRKRVYPRLVQEGRMDPRKSEDETECMESIVATLTRLKRSEDEKIQPSLI